MAQLFVDRVLAAVTRLEAFPRSGRVVPEIGQQDIREIIFGSYRIVYVVSEDVRSTFSRCSMPHGSYGLQIYQVEETEVLNKTRRAS